MIKLCWGCRSVREAAYIDAAGRPYCAECAAMLPAAQSAILLAYLAETVPYKIGDTVSCKTGGQVFDGIGHVVEVSFSPEHLASPVVPMFRVAIDEKAYPEMVNEMWYPENCLERVG